MKCFYEVYMMDPHCPSEKCSMGLFPSQATAEEYIAEDRLQYSDRMEWTIETVPLVGV